MRRRRLDARQNPEHGEPGHRAGEAGPGTAERLNRRGKGRSICGAAGLEREPGTDDDPDERLHDQLREQVDPENR